MASSRVIAIVFIVLIATILPAIIGAFVDVDDVDKSENDSFLITAISTLPVVGGAISGYIENLKYIPFYVFAPLITVLGAMIVLGGSD